MRSTHAAATRSNHKSNVKSIDKTRRDCNTRIGPRNVWLAIYLIHCFCSLVSPRLHYTGIISLAYKILPYCQCFIITLKFNCQRNNKKTIYSHQPNHRKISFILLISSLIPIGLCIIFCLVTSSGGSILLISS